MAHPHLTGPAKDDQIVIVGAGVFGLSLALELSSRGYKSISVLDRYLPPVIDGSSVDISRVIRTDYADPLEVGEAPFLTVSQWNVNTRDTNVTKMQQWMTEYNAFYHHSGFVMLSETHANTYIEKCKEDLREQGKFLEEFNSADKIKDIYPSIQGDLSAMTAYHNPAGGWADAESSIRWLAHRCSLAGISFLTGSQGTVISLKMDGPCVIGVQVASGRAIAASQVILATGAWSNRLVDMSHATSSSGQPVGFIQLTEEEAKGLEKTPVMINLTSGVFCFPPTPDTHVLKIARHGFGYATQVHVEGSNRTVSSPKLDGENATSAFLPHDAEQGLRQGLRQLMPDFADRPFMNCRLCWYTDTPEGNFVVDRHPQFQGLFVATGGAGQ
ncbi:hypothetical protein BDV24DRAFT_171493 [Neofusicoccum parvum]|uniref:Uncharacterized protein n=1 Tax=Neofusicoccum parvum TaxID=310453 RepID=A0ACB5SPU1_9PEZI|nr:hypothetical protein BDV24DRAFT_171493 [Neofusicoccum parvum]